MRLEPLYRVEFTYPQGWSIELACTGRIAGRMRGANHPAAARTARSALTSRA
jgi:hypothetical protein